jgi:signal transduction histidine kinase
LSYYIIGTILLIKKYKAAIPEAKVKLAYIIGATTTTGIIDITFYLILIPFVNSRYLWVGPLGGFIWVSVLTIAITKYELMGIRVFVTRKMGFLIASTLYGLMYLLIGQALFHYIYPMQAPIFIGYGFAIAVITLTTFDLARNQIQTFSDWLIFRQKIEKEIFNKTVVTLMHEINSPLTVLIMSAQSLSKIDGLSDPAPMLISLIKINSNKIKELLKKLNAIQSPTEKDYIGDVKMIRLEE